MKYRKIIKVISVIEKSSGTWLMASHHCCRAPPSRHFLLFRSYAPAHTCTEKKRARANTHAHIHIVVKNVVLATQHEQSFTPVHSSPRVTLRSFEGLEGRGCRSERERGFAEEGRIRQGRRRAATKRRKNQKRGMKRKREVRPVWGGTFILVTWNSLPPPAVALKPLSLSSPVQLWFWSRVTPP